YIQYMGLYAELANSFASPTRTTEQSLRQRCSSEEEREIGRGGEGEKRQEAASVSLSPYLPISPSSSRPLRFSRRRRWLLAGAAALAAAAALILILPIGPRVRIFAPPAPSADPGDQDNTVAVLLQTHCASWENTNLPTRPGAPLPPGRLLLKAGF